jgi:YidC/Oxa1 family membrane protein insertase
MDKNTIIGILLMAMMFLGYQMLMPAPEPVKPPETKTVAKAATQPIVPKLDSVASKALYGDFAKAAQGVAKDIVIENDDARITFSSLGGGVKEVLLKKYKTYQQKPLYLIDSQSSRFKIELPTTKGNINLSSLYFETTAQNQVLKAGQTAKVIFKLPIAANQFVEQTYTVQGSGYVVDYDLNLIGLDGTLKNEPAKLVWDESLKQFENDLNENRKVVTTNYFADKSVSDIGRGQTSNVEEKIEESVSWFTHKNKYFLTGFIAKNAPMTAVTAKSLVDEADSSYVKTMQTEAALSITDLKTGKGNFQFYFGPNDYQIVKEVKAANFGDNVDLGYAFLRPLNKFFFVPLFSFFEKYISNYGILIIVLVLFVKLLMTPLVYKSYISMAKMRVLAPELAVIKEKVGDDQTKMQQEQMKLYQQVGVSPLSGCIPVLATMPILMALFSLFPNLIELRQKSFLWAQDLSTYDAPIHLPFTIPFYGSHVSIFTLLMTISQVLFAWYNNQTTPTQTQPGMPNMKVMGYIMPVMFMFIMNSFPAGLSFYYFISNLVTIGQQQIIRRFVDETKLKTVLDENRVKIASGVKKQSKFSAMLEKSMKAAEEAKKGAEDAKKKYPPKKN